MIYNNGITVKVREGVTVNQRRYHFAASYDLDDPGIGLIGAPTTIKAGAGAAMEMSVDQHARAQTLRQSLIDPKLARFESEGRTPVAERLTWERVGCSQALVYRWAADWLRPRCWPTPGGTNST